MLAYVCINHILRPENGTQSHPNLETYITICEKLLFSTSITTKYLGKTWFLVVVRAGVTACVAIVKVYDNSPRNDCSGLLQ